MNQLVELQKLIEKAFVQAIEEGYNDNKIWWSEFDIKGIFYHLLRPTVDLIPEYELYWEWFVKDHDNSKKFVDLVIVESVFSEKWGKAVREGYVRIALEFKWSNMAFKSEFKKRIEDDLRNLSKLMKEGSQDHEYELEINLYSINKGNSPNHAYMFIIDVTKGEERIQEANELYLQFEKEFPEIRIIWAFPNK